MAEDADGIQLGLGFSVAQVGALTVWRLDLPFLPPSKNVYDGWPPEWKHGAKKKWLRWIERRAVELAIPQGLYEVGLAARLIFPTNNRRDPQNYAQALWNWVPDGLVRCGVLQDDRDGRVKIGPNWGIDMRADLRPTIAKKWRQRTIITVSAVVPPARG